LLDGVDPSDEGVAEYAGWAWLVILPLTGGAIGVVWLGVVVLWAPCVFVVSGCLRGSISGGKLKS